VLLWDEQNRHEVGTLPGNLHSVARLQFSADGGMLAVTTENRWTRIWNVGRLKLVAEFAHRAATAPTGWMDIGAVMCFSPDGKLYAQGEGWGYVEMWNIAQERPVGFWQADKKFVSGMAFSPDGKTIATSGYDDIVHLWDVTTHVEVKTFESSNLGSLFAVTFSPDGRRLIAGTPDGLVKLWDTESAQELLGLKGHQSGVDCVSFTPDGETLVSANGSGVIRWVAPKLTQVQ
jgi:hypothetical protein